MLQEVDDCLAELNHLVLSLIQQAVRSIKCLHEIKWNEATYSPDTIIDYIDWMIETEKIECKEDVKTALVLTLSESSADNSSTLWQGVLKWWDWESADI